MRWNLNNILGGAASVQLFAQRQDYRQVLAAVQSRAEQERVPAALALNRFMRERMLGQALMTLSCLGLLALALTGATHDWPEPFVLLSAAGPMLLTLAVSLAHSQQLKRHK